ncbi:MAG: hypothetical protein EOO71_14540 [Myxococcaceae bacterium]|nr:MAG: hypothetical protein EOO71_14540 [Myxococcaceae bacterium]
MSLRRLSLLLIPTCAVGLGCSEPESLERRVPSVEDPECPASTSVFVTADTRFHSGAQVTAIPQDLSGRDLELLILRGNDYDRRSGRVVSKGLCFGDVGQDAEFYVRSGTAYYRSHARRFDLSVNRHGRPDAVASAVTETPARLDLTGLQPWQASASPSEPGSQLQVVSGEVEWVARLDFPTARPGAGVTLTQGAEARASSQWGALPVLDAAKGDRLYVNQLNEVPSGTLPSGAPLKYRTVVGSLHAPAASFTPNGDTALALSGALTEVEQASFTPEWILSAFTAHRAEAHPDAVIAQGRFDVLPVTYGLRAGRVGRQGELFTLEVPGDETGELTRRFTYGNPYPASWGIMGSASYTFLAPTSVVVGGQSWRPNASIVVMDRLSRMTADDPVVPGVSPPRLVRIDGAEAATVRSVSSTRPVVSWQSPQEGLPRAYQVEFIPLTADAATAPTVEFHVPSDTLSLTPPPGVLAAGATYYVRVTANGSPFFVPWQAPYTSADLLPIRTAGTFSAVFTTPS